MLSCGHAVERVLPKLRIASRRADVAVAVDDAGRDEILAREMTIELPAGSSSNHYPAASG